MRSACPGYDATKLCDEIFTTAVAARSISRHETHARSELIHIRCGRARFILRIRARARSIDNAVMNLNAQVDERHGRIYGPVCTNSEI